MVKRITWAWLWKDSVCCLLMLSLLCYSILIWKILSLLLHFKSFLTSAWNLFLTGSFVLKLWATRHRLALSWLSILWASTANTFWRWHRTRKHKILKITYNSLFSLLVLQLKIISLIRIGLIIHYTNISSYITYRSSTLLKSIHYNSSISWSKFFWHLRYTFIIYLW